MTQTRAIDLEAMKHRGDGKFPGLVGVVITAVGEREITGELSIRDELMAPNGYLHAGCIITLADTCAGYGCYAAMPAEAVGFTTVEIKSNHVGTARTGTLLSSARAVHVGKTTQVWDSVVTHKETGKTIALFRCTQMILYPQ